MSVMNSTVGSWSTLLLNVCDLSRFAPSQKDQVGFGSAMVKVVRWSCGFGWIRLG